MQVFAAQPNLAPAQEVEGGWAVANCMVSYSRYHIQTIQTEAELQITSWTAIQRLTSSTFVLPARLVHPHSYFHPGLWRYEWRYQASSRPLESANMQFPIRRLILDVTPLVPQPGLVRTFASPSLEAIARVHVCLQGTFSA